MAVTILVPEGSKEIYVKEWQGEIGFPSPVQDDGLVGKEIVSGRIFQQGWEIPSAQSDPLMEAMIGRYVREGFTLNFQCASEECGGFEFRYALETPSSRDFTIEISNYVYADLALDDLRVTLIASKLGENVYVLQTQAQLEPSEDIAFLEQPLAIGTSASDRVILNSVTFETGSSHIAQYDPLELQDIADRLKANPSQTVYLVGHSDQDGGLEANIAISDARANRVRELLVREFSVPSSRIQARGVGFLAPIADNATQAGRARNRRVEAVFLVNG